MTPTPQLLTLDSGLRLVLDPVPTAESLTLGCWINVGARHETAATSGLAHMVEHMVFKGTRARSAFDIVSQIEGQGGAINAYTGRETTAFYCRLLKDDLALGLDILSDLLLNARMDAGDLEKERQVILSELHQAIDTSDDIIFDHFQATAFPSQGLGRSVLGDEGALARLSPKDLRQFCADAYQGSAMVVVVSGRFDAGEAEALVRKRFAAIPPGQAPGFESGAYVGGEYIEVRQGLEQAHVLLGWEGAALEGPGYYAQTLLATMLGGGMSSRLFQQVREEWGLAYSVSAFLSPFADTGLFSAYAACDADQLEALLPLMAKTMKQATKDLSEEELARAKQQIKASLLMSQESTLSRAESYASQLQVFGRLMSNEELLAPLEAVTLDMVKAVAANLLNGPMTYAVISAEPPSLKLGDVEELFGP